MPVKPGKGKKRGIPEPRKGREVVKDNFDFHTESYGVARDWARAAREWAKGPSGVITFSTRGGLHWKRHNRAFGTEEKIRGAQHIGTMKTKYQTMNWHVDRRKKSGTVLDRRK